ncbi:hypothetical protein [Acidisoma sp. C75]
MALAAAMTTPASALTLDAPVGLSLAQPAYTQNGLSNATVLIVRHAEKPGFGPGLSDAGDMRALAYAQYFKSLAIGGAPVHIDSLVAASDTPSSARPRLTLEPLSQEMGVRIAQPCAETDVHQLVSWLRSRPQPGTTLIAWHHTKISKLLAAFGADPKSVLPGGRWPNDVFDQVVVLRFDAGGKLIPGQTRLLQEPNSVNNVVWKAMSHPTIRPFEPFLMQSAAVTPPKADEQLAAR